MGMTWVRLTSPTVGLKPTTPLTDAGQVMEPSVSVPMAAGAKPIATATALPAEEPHGVLAASNAFSVCPPTALHPGIDAEERKLAHSERLVLPRITAPAVRRRATSGESLPGEFCDRASDPAVVGMSRVSILSLMRIGIPAMPSPSQR